MRNPIAGEVADSECSLPPQVPAEKIDKLSGEVIEQMGKRGPKLMGMLPWSAVLASVRLDGKTMCPRTNIFLPSCRA